MRTNYTAVISCGHMIEANAVAREHLRDAFSVIDMKFRDVANIQTQHIESTRAAQPVSEPDMSGGNNTAQDHQPMDIDSANTSPPATEPVMLQGNDLDDNQAMDIDFAHVSQPITDHDYDDSSKSKCIANEQPVDTDIC